MNFNSTEQTQRSLSLLNTALLGIVLFFLVRLVTQFDAVANNVNLISQEIAVMKNKLEAHDRDIEVLKLKTRNHHEKATH